MKEEWARKYLNEISDRCWFCGKNGCDEFDVEFDTFLHIKCLKKTLQEEPNHPEAVLMKYLLN